MRTALRVQAGVGDPQPLHGPAGNQVLAHDLFGVFGLHSAIPDRVGIDDDRRPVLALIQAPGFVDAHLASQTGFARQLLQPRM